MSESVFQIKIEPSEFMGWRLYHSPSHDGEGDFRADKNNMVLFAKNLPSLLDKIRKEEELTVEFSKPICALLKHYGVKAIRILRMHEGKFEYETVGGKVDSAYMHLVTEGRSHDQELLFDSPENRKLIRDIVKADDGIKQAYAKKEQLEKRMKRISIPWLMMEAKRQGAVKRNPQQAKEKS